MDIRHTGLTMNQSERVHVPEMDLIIGGCYRQWKRNCRQNQWKQQNEIVTQTMAAAMVTDVVFVGDFNLNMDKADDLSTPTRTSSTTGCRRPERRACAGSRPATRGPPMEDTWARGGSLRLT